MRLLARIVALLAVAVAGTAQAQNLSIATGGTGGVYYPLGGGMAAVLSKYVDGMQATAEVTGGSGANLPPTSTGKPDVAFTMTDAALDALKGEDKFKGKPVPVRTLMILYPNRMHVVTLDGTNIRKIEDLKGKRVSTGSGGSATQVMALRVIEAAGLDKGRDKRPQGRRVRGQGGGGPRQGSRHAARAARRGGVGFGAQGSQDRRLFLGRWPADRGSHGPCQHAGHQNQADRPRASRARHEQEVRQPLREGQHRQGCLQGHGEGQRAGHRDEHPGGAREDRRQDRVQHREGGVRAPRRADPRAQGGGKHQAREPEKGSFAAAMASRRDEILRREGPQAAVGPAGPASPDQEAGGAF